MSKKKYEDGQEYKNRKSKEEESSIFIELFNRLNEHLESNSSVWHDL